MRRWTAIHAMPLSSTLDRPPTGNLFLDALGDASAAALVPYLEPYQAATGDSIARSGSAIEFAIFPIEGVISTVARMRDGSDIEVSIVGRDGFYDVRLALGDPRTSSDAMVQLPGAMHRLPTQRFLDALREDDALRKRVLGYTQATLETLSQFSACNRLHSIHERCARWLLMAHDRVAGDVILLTHEYLAMMLGVRRPGVSIAAAALDRSGYIAYQRGRIVVLDRDGLESASCECYATANDMRAKIFGYDIRKHASNAVSAA